MELEELIPLGLTERLQYYQRIKFKALLECVQFRPRKQGNNEPRKKRC